MKKILYANPYSIFDYTSGSAKSIKLFLENFNTLGIDVYSISSFISCSKSGYLNTLKIFNQNQISNLKASFLSNGINCTIIKSSHWDRRKFTLSEEKLFFQETSKLMKKISFDLIIGWGNLNLEEKIFKEAKLKDIKICFYLVNPSYWGKEFYLKENADFVLTDSIATKVLYKNFIKKKIHVLPKVLEKHSININNNSYSKNCLVINPSINKGIEPLLKLSKTLEKIKSEISIWVIDGRNTFYDELSYLGYSKNELPKNLILFPACEDIYKIYKNVSIVLVLSLWHESGSRVISEAYSTGLPVICFDTGGNKEFIDNNKDDIFEMPKFKKDFNNRIRLTSWNEEPIVKRICFLLNNKNFYDTYQKNIFKLHNTDDKNIKFKRELSDFLRDINF